MSLRPFRLSGDPAVEIANISDRLLVRINSMNPLADGAEDGERRNPGAPEDLGPNRREVISAPGSVPRRWHPRAVTTSSVAWSVASSRRLLVGKILPAACFRRFSTPP